MQHSETLLTEILLLLQSLNANVHDLKAQLGAVKGDLDGLKGRFDTFMEQAMPEHVLAVHVRDHEKLSEPGRIRKFLLKVLQ